MSEDHRPPDDPEPTHLDSADLGGNADDSTRTSRKEDPGAGRQGGESPDDGLPGKQIGDFELLSELGRGGMGIVY